VPKLLSAYQTSSLLSNASGVCSSCRIQPSLNKVRIQVNLCLTELFENRALHSSKLCCLVIRVYENCCLLSAITTQKRLKQAATISLFSCWFQNQYINYHLLIDVCSEFISGVCFWGGLFLCSLKSVFNIYQSKFGISLHARGSLL
jgi:hypothetical protein